MQHQNENSSFGLQKEPDLGSYVFVVLLVLQCTNNVFRLNYFLLEDAVT